MGRGQGCSKDAAVHRTTSSCHNKELSAENINSVKENKA
jgi:hypothetical protein